MMNRVTLPLVAFVFLCALNISSPTAGAYARNNNGITELTGGPAAASSHTHDQGNAAHTTPVPFEPLLLLLLGSTLFSIGTAIKVILSRQFENNSVRQAARGKTTTRPGLVG